MGWNPGFSESHYHSLHASHTHTEGLGLEEAAVEAGEGGPSLLGVWAQSLGSGTERP